MFSSSLKGTKFIFILSGLDLHEKKKKEKRFSYLRLGIMVDIAGLKTSFCFIA